MTSALAHSAALVAVVLLLGLGFSLRPAAMIAGSRNSSVMVEVAGDRRLAVATAASPHLLADQSARSAKSGVLR
jgi:hypothetical protein